MASVEEYCEDAQCHLPDVEDSQLPGPPTPAAGPTPRTPKKRGIPKKPASPSPKAAPVAQEGKAPEGEEAAEEEKDQKKKKKKKSNIRGEASTSAASLMSPSRALVARTESMLESTDQEMLESLKRNSPSSSVPDQVWLHHSLAEGAWIELATQCLKDYKPASVCENEQWRSFAARRAKYLSSLQPSEAAPGVKWLASWNYKVISTEYKQGGKDTPRSGEPKGVQKMSTQVNRAFTKKLKKQLADVQKMRRKAEADMAKTTERLSRLEAAERKIINKAHEKGLSLD